ncbi:helix-turn-helix domain-containing protein [bacterium]|nr:helix-turn-helix domain-containing protein [bacterium]
MEEKNYSVFAWRRAMKVQEVILKAIAGEIKWIQAADILRVSARTIRRKFRSYQEYGIDGLLDLRTCRPSRRRIPYVIVEQVLRLYREEYFDFNIRPFYPSFSDTFW